MLARKSRKPLTKQKASADNMSWSGSALREGRLSECVCDGPVPEDRLSASRIPPSLPSQHGVRQGTAHRFTIESILYPRHGKVFTLMIYLSLSISDCILRMACP